jgi:hypothetical protein
MLALNLLLKLINKFFFFFRLMKELRDIYRSPNFKSGAYQVQPRYAILDSEVISGLVFEAGCFHYVLLCLESG